MTKSQRAEVPTIVLPTAFVGVSVELCTGVIGGNDSEEDQGKETSAFAIPTKALGPEYQSATSGHH